MMLDATFAQYVCILRHIFFFFGAHDCSHFLKSDFGFAVYMFSLIYHCQCPFEISIKW
jgi:hypothetical protein